MALTFGNNQVFFLISAKRSIDPVKEEELVERRCLSAIKIQIEDHCFALMKADAKS